MSASVLVDRHGSWLEITLNRPDRLNSFNDEMHAWLAAVLEQARDDGTRAVLLTGAGRGFCAGQDLGDRDPAKLVEKPDLSRTILTWYAPLVRLLRDLPVPVVCAVNGVAAGAGANIALACDIVLAARSARFIQSFARVGLIPDAGGTWMLPRLVGPARAMALAMTAEPVDADQAAQWGMIWKALPDAELMAGARDLTARLAAGPTIGLGLVKQALHHAANNTLEQQLDLEAASQKTCGESPDYAEGVRAFLEKRDPVFTGRWP